MSGRDKREEPSDSVDELLREVARAPDRDAPRTRELQRIAHFRVLEELGRGGMGIVYRAQDESLRRVVALKVLPPSVEQDDERRRRLLREARAAAAVTHPNIAAVHEVGVSDGCVFIAMELVDGKTLREIIEDGPLPVADALAIAMQIARGLARAHQANIVHRDLKPDNVIVGDDGHTKILDFGLAKLFATDDPTTREIGEAETATLEGHIRGTPAYMAPEQARGAASVGPAADVFAFGVTLYEMLAGRRPFVGSSLAEIAAAVERGVPEPASHRNREVSDALDGFIARCLDKDAGARIADGAALVRELSVIVAPVAQPVSTRRRPSRVAWRAVVGVVLAAVAAIAITMAWRRGANAPVPIPIRASSAASAIPPTKGIAMTDHPPPKTASPAAAAAYSNALRNLRGASGINAHDGFERATRLDPAFAAAHLRCVLHFAHPGRLLTTVAAREHYLAALGQSALLDDRDRALLSVAEALTTSQFSDAESIARLRPLREAYPDDAEITFLLGSFLVGTDSDEAREILHAAQALDPGAAIPLHAEGNMLTLNGMVDAGLEKMAECLRVSPAAASCLRVIAEVHEERGECAAFEADARRMVEIEPNGRRAHEYLARSLAARGAPPEAVRAALDAMVADEVGTGMPAAPTALWFALLTGDFVAAERAAHDFERLQATAPEESAHISTAYALLDIAEERGDTVSAIAIADAFQRKVSAWTPDVPQAIRARRLYLLSAAHRIADEDFVRERDALYQQRLTLEGSGPGTPGSVDDIVWLFTFARWPETSAHARDVLGRLTTPPSSSISLGLNHNFLFGKLYALAGRVDDALPYFERATKTCSILPDTQVSDSIGYTRRFLRAHLFLGQLLEAKNDKPGACKAYGVVIDRWKHATARSITLETAKLHAHTLACP